MNSRTIDELLEVFSNSISFYYYKDKFLLDRIVKLELPVIDSKVLREHGLGHYAQKPLIKQLLKQNNGRIDSQTLFAHWPANSKVFNLTFAKWGEAPKRQKDSWYQTSRSGFSLVIQLNFSTEHNIDFFRLLKPKYGRSTFEYSGHPIAESGFITMAWSRVDIDFDTNEALVEELQTDWLRDVMEANKYFKESVGGGKNPWILGYRGLNCSEAAWLRYMETVRSYISIWSEALLHATVGFLKSEIGVSKIWMHSFESGNLFKEIGWTKPPKSLYTKLPRSYGFESITEGPEFLLKEKYLKRFFKKARNLQVTWNRLPRSA